MSDGLPHQDDRRQVRAFPELWHDEPVEPARVPRRDGAGGEASAEGGAASPRGCGAVPVGPAGPAGPAGLAEPGEATSAGSDAPPSEPARNAGHDSGVAALDDECQPTLYTPESEARAELGRSIEEGRFEEALVLHEELRATYLGPHDDALAARLERLAACRWEPEGIAALLSTWEDLQRALPEPGLRGRRTLAEEKGFFRRLAGVAPLEEIARRHRRCIPGLANAALREDGTPFRARAIARDALLAGLPVDADVLAFDEPATRDVLAGDGSPERLACLGELRRTWPPSPPSAEELAGLAELADLADLEVWSTEDAPDDEAQRLRRALTCLRFARAPSTAAEARATARRLLRTLDAELHAELMRD